MEFGMAARAQILQSRGLSLCGYAPQRWTREKRLRLRVNGHGKVGIDLAGKYDVGVHTHGNNIRLGEGACVELDEKGEIKVRYREGKIEFLNGDKRVAYIEMNGNDHAL